MKKGLRWYANRISRMDAKELMWRCTSLASDLTEAARVKTGTVPTVLGPLPAAGFEVSQLSHAEYQAALSASDQSLLCEAADLVCRNALHFFGRTVEMPQGTNWHRDWHQSIDSSKRLSIFVDYRDAQGTGDCKEVWEPNRHHQLVVLANAYKVSGQQRYADKVAELLQSWIDANPYGYGMNWRSPLELGIRVINWVWALDLIKDSNAVGPALSASLHQSAFLHCRDLQRHFSQGSSANNHLIGEAAGLFVAASYWFAQSHPEWISESKDILAREIALQQYPSGATREQALNYQFFVAQFYIYCGLVGEWTGDRFDAHYWSQLATYLSYLESYEGFDACLPLYGDQDDGYVLNLGRTPHDLADYRAWSSALTGTVDPTHGPSVLTLSGRAPDLPLAPQNTKSCATGALILKDAGYAILRSTKESATAVLFDAGDLGYGSMAAHGHADALHFALSIRNEPVFVDSGTYDYFTYPEQRNYFRSTRAHNTISLDDQDQSVMSGPFMWSRAAQAAIVAEQDTEAMSSVTGEITDYPAIADKFKSCQRTISVNKKNGAVQITDQIAVAARTSIAQYFHLHPNVQVKALDARTYELVTSRSTLLLTIDDKLEHELVTQGELAQYSPRYHQMQTSACIKTHARLDAEGQFQFSITQSPRGSGAPDR